MSLHKSLRITLHRIALGLPIIAFTGHPLTHLIRGTSFGAPPWHSFVPSVPQRLVAVAPIWWDTLQADSGKIDDRIGDTWFKRPIYRGFAYLPVTIHGHAATIYIDLRSGEQDLRLSSAALATLGVTLPETDTLLDAITFGTDVQRHVPFQRIGQWNWYFKGPPHLPPVVGAMGVDFLATHWDVVYNTPKRQVQLYAFPAAMPAPSASHHLNAQDAWLPPGITPADCGKMIAIPPGAQTFTGMEMHVDGHPVTGVLEMGLYAEKFNTYAFKLLGLSEHDPRIKEIPPQQQPGGGVTQYVDNVQLSMGGHPFWTGPVQIFPQLGVDNLLSQSRTPVMLMNLTTIAIKPGLMVYNAASSQQVCIAKPGASA